MHCIIHVFASHICIHNMKWGCFHYPSFQQGILTSSPLDKSCLVYIPHSKCCTRLQYYWPWLTAFIFTEESWRRGGMNLCGFGEWKYSGVMLCAVSQGISPAQWEVSHFVALLEETEEKERERERIWQGYAVNCFFAGGFVFTRSLSPSSLSHCTKTYRWRKHSERIWSRRAPAPWSQPNTDRDFSTSLQETCSVATTSLRSVSLIFAIESCCLLLCYLTCSRFPEEKLFAIS